MLSMSFFKRTNNRICCLQAYDKSVLTDPTSGPCSRMTDYCKPSAYALRVINV